MKTMTTWTDAASGAGSAVTTWNYDAARGWLTNKAYANGQGPFYTNTAAGRLALRKWASGTNTTYTYNNAGELSGVDYSDPGTPDVTYVYDRLGRQTTNVQGSITTTRAYDLPGNLLSEKYSGGPLNGLTVSNLYDAYFRRVTNGLYNGSTWLVLNGYAYDASNRLSVVTDRTNSATYAYLANSSLIDRITFQQNGNTRMVTAKAYDNLNRLTAIVSSNNSAVVLASFHYAYNLANQRTAVTNADSTRWSFGYDTLGQVTAGKKYWSDATVVAGQQFEYEFDDIGNREFAGSGGNEWGTVLRYQHYTANNLNQYTQRTVPGAVDVLGAAHSNATVTVNLQPTYRKGEYFRGEIATDNSTAARWLALTNVGVLPEVTLTVTNDILSTNLGHAFIPKTPEIFAHDKDGNLATNGQWLLTWDAENRLISAETQTSVTNSGVPRQRLVFTYDAQSRRTSKSVSNWVAGAWQLGCEQRFAYDGWNPIAIVSSSATFIQSLLWGLDLSGTLQGAGGVGGLLVVNDATNAAHFCAFDGNGNVSGLVSATASSVTATYEYAPFGGFLRAEGSMAEANYFSFSTKFLDRELGFYYYGYRYYDPVLGRWPNRDPLQEQQGGPNLFACAHNNLVNHFDFLGLTCNTCPNEAHAQTPRQPSPQPKPPHKCDIGTLKGWKVNPVKILKTAAAARKYCTDKQTRTAAPACSFPNYRESISCKACGSCRDWRMVVNVTADCDIYVTDETQVTSIQYVPNRTAAIAHETCHCDDWKDAFLALISRLGSKTYKSKAECERAKSAIDFDKLLDQEIAPSIQHVGPKWGVNPFNPNAACYAQYKGKL